MTNNLSPYVPLFRSSIGFDRLFSQLSDTATAAGKSNYPPYNIQALDETHYRVTLAVAGFQRKDLDVTIQRNVLKITGVQDEQDGAEQQGQWLHRGIATRAFERSFQLADHVRVAGASLVNGLLKVDLVREVPEEDQPHSVNIDEVIDT